MSFVLVPSRASPTEKQPFLFLFVKCKGSYNKLWKGCLWKFRARFATQSPKTTRLNLWSSELLSGMGSPRQRGAGGAAGQRWGGGKSPPARRDGWKVWRVSGSRLPAEMEGGWGLQEPSCLPSWMGSFRGCRIPSACRAEAGLSICRILPVYRAGLGLVGLQRISCLPRGRGAPGTESVALTPTGEGVDLS